MKSPLAKAIKESINLGMTKSGKKVEVDFYDYEQKEMMTLQECKEVMAVAEKFIAQECQKLSKSKIKEKKKSIMLIKKAISKWEDAIYKAKELIKEKELE